MTTISDIEVIQFTVPRAVILNGMVRHEDTCEYYERGLLAPGIDGGAPEPYLERNCDVCAPVPSAPGLGCRIDRVCIDALRPEQSC